jgi:hypothetical protein
MTSDCAPVGMNQHRDGDGALIPYAGNALRKAASRMGSLRRVSAA